MPASGRPSSPLDAASSAIQPASARRPRSASRTLGNSARSPDVSPLRAADLSRLPPAYVALASHDPLTDEAEDYADRLRSVGVDVEVKVWPGTVHGFIRWRAGVDVARDALDEAAARLRATLAD